MSSNEKLLCEFICFPYLHVRVNHLLKFIWGHLGHGVYQIEQLATDSIVRTLPPGQDSIHILRKIQEKFIFLGIFFDIYSNLVKIP